MNPSIAIIYKDSSAAASVSRVLTSAGMRAGIYRSVAEFLEDERRSACDCLVLDSAFLEDEDPRAGLAEHLPVVVLARTDGPKFRTRAREFGASAFFHEPLDGEALLDAIRWELSRAESDERPSSNHPDNSN